MHCNADEKIAKIAIIAIIENHQIPAEVLVEIGDLSSNSGNFGTYGILAISLRL